MSLETRINQDLKAAMQQKDQVALRGIRAIKSAILLVKTEKGASGELNEQLEIKLLQKLLKQRQDSITIFEQQDRDDLAQTEHEEVAVIEKYLPEQISEGDIDALLINIISKTGAQSMKDMGKVMGLANQQLAGRADGKTLAAKVKVMLAS